jgi:hypothetical protein
MADKFSQRPTHIREGTEVERWIQEQYLDVSDGEKDVGPIVHALTFDGETVMIPANRAMICFDQVDFMRQGTNQNHGSGGSNCTSGCPQFICTIDKECMMADFTQSKKGIFKDLRGNFYCTPLIHLSQASELRAFVDDRYAAWVALKKTNNAHSSEHIANGIASQLATITYYLAHEISLTDTPQIDRVRLTSLVEMLYCMASMARDIASIDTVVDKIFRILPHTTSVADILQAILMSYIFDEVPNKITRYNWVGLTLKRYFRHCGKDASMTMANTPAVGQIACFLVAPLIANCAGSDLTMTQIVDLMIEKIEFTIKNIVLDLKQCKTIPEKNICIIRGFIRASDNPLIDISKVEKIFQIIENDESIEDNVSELGISTSIPFVDTESIELNGNSHHTKPVLINQSIDGSSTIATGEQKPTTGEQKPTTGEQIAQGLDQYVGCSVTYIPSDPREWCGLRLKSGCKYTVQFTPIGLGKFEKGSTIGKMNVANFRFTAGTDILQGNCTGLSASGKIFDPASQRYFDMKSSDFQKICVDEPFTITAPHKSKTRSENIVVEQNNVVFQIPIARGLSEQESNPLIGFKFCKAHITLSKVLKTTELVDQNGLVKQSVWGGNFAQSLRK